MNVKFTDVCHLRILGNDIFKSDMKSLIWSYRIRKMYTPSILTGIVGMLTSYQTQKKRMEAAMKLCKDWDDYKRIFVNQLEQEA